ncbi:hypothetical protein GLOTRDRAFT_123194 [Gloeophyllum trabeum ATCC 11539]|uniref:LysM domain-containing protein n=1 Tax=Gloeophyllum trabeum (strain ATCC 11539 / FP-39264 / Madison 617) TaxID=670483 RepID=S7PVL9_GLOTA|nr:uncharacterized protein GLOTRDRAFT_123194 [Gloeophyllum trabeum ATCC 11539]EPQ51676.1 hypothetical protein GLOTRDRAFT_123194 [Gloeophyllum trabeum ATCC 11539]
MFASARLVVAAAVLSATIASAQSAICARNYTVHLGDTCDAISAQQGVSTYATFTHAIIQHTEETPFARYQLAFVNQGRIDAACDNLALGEPLCLGIQGQDCGSVHVVYSGDSCLNIVDSTGVSLTTLLANNPNVNAECSNIYPGEVLCTANQVFNYTTVYNYTSTA